MSKKKNVTIVAVALIALVGVMGVTFAMFSYMRTGSKNSQLIVGDIYMKYNETDTVINISDMTPRSTKPSEYFEFTVEGKNTYTEKDIVYDINIMHGDTVTSKERIKDEFLRFTLEVDKTGSGTFTPVVENASYIDFASGLRIAKDYIEAETNNKVTHTYRLYVWIDESVVIYGGDLTSADGDYSVSEWNNLYASVKVNVTGYFQEKQVPQNLYEVVRTGAVSDSNIDFGVLNENGKYYRHNTESTTYPIYYYRGTVENNNVIFANKCWKIVRTTETGGTKMIYNGELSALYSKEFTDADTYISENEADVFNFDNNDNTWNIKINDGSIPELSFKVPDGDNYIMSLSATTGSTCGGSIAIFKDDDYMDETSGGDGNNLILNYTYGTLTSSNVLKVQYIGTSSPTCEITIKVNMQRDTAKLSKNEYNLLTRKSTGEFGCDNTASNSQLPTTSAWNSSYNSLAYIGYNYGKVYEMQSGSKSGTYWNGVKYEEGKYSLADFGTTSTYLNETHHYICDDENCIKVRYYFKQENYIVLENGKTVEDALKEMLSESSDTIKSPIHETINAWYNTNIKTTYGNYVEDTEWCNDRSVSTANLGGWNPNGGSLIAHYMYFDVYKRMQSKYASEEPKLTCDNVNDIMTVKNEKLENPIALLTYDEVALAGGIYLEGTLHYLDSQSFYWLLSPAWIHTNDVLVGGVDFGGSLGISTSVHSTYPGVRPALSLKHGTQVFEGDGSVSNPYVVGTPRT